MSDEAFSRSRLREDILWKPFLGNNRFFNSDDITERVLIFGLYAGVYQHGHDYLEVIESEQLQMIIDEYTQNMAQIDNESAKLVIDLAARRYLATIDQQIHDERMRTKQNQLDAENDRWDSKIAALEADQDALETLRQKTILAESKAVNKINEISAQILNEQYAQSELDNEQLRKQLELSQAELKILRSALRGLEIQAQINESAYQLYKVDADIAGINAQVAMTQADIARNQNIELELSVQQQRNDNYEYEITEKTAARLSDVDSKEDLLNDEIGAVEDYEDQEGLEKAEKRNSLNINNQSRLSNIDLSREKGVFNADQREKSLRNDIPFAFKRQETREHEDKNRRTLIHRQTRSVDRKMRAAINAAEIIAKANITTSLMHEIGS